MVTIADLRDCPEFLPLVADRVWRAWWQRRGTPLAEVTGWVEVALRGRPIPSVYVAHEGETFLGTASVIASDLGARPDYTPWVAAVWVEEAARHRGIGRAIVQRAAEAILAGGFPRAYLAAAPHRRSFYEELGWTPIEEGIGADSLTLLVWQAA